MMNTNKKYTVFCINNQNIDGLSYNELKVLYGLLKQQKLDNIVFYDGHVKNVFDFIALLTDSQTFFYLICSDENENNELSLIRGKIPLALVWLNGFTGSSAMIHFCVYRHAFAESYNIGLFTTRMLLLGREGKETPYEVCVGSRNLKNSFLEKNKEETFCLDALYGLTPAPYTHALNFIYSLGFEKVGVLPYTATIIKKDKETIVPCILSLLTRHNLK